MIFLAVGAALLVVHALWSADRAQKRVSALLEATIAQARDERALWNDERLSLLARQDALHTPPMGYSAPPPPAAAPGPTNATEDGEVAMIEEFRRRALLGENL